MTVALAIVGIILISPSFYCLLLVVPNYVAELVKSRIHRMGIVNATDAPQNAIAKPKPSGISVVAFDQSGKAWVYSSGTASNFNKAAPASTGFMTDQFASRHPPENCVGHPDELPPCPYKNGVLKTGVRGFWL
jgi:hypothetical protein